MLTFVCWKWRRPSTGHQLPSVCEYGARHVNVLQRMLHRHVRTPHRLICLTDDPTGLMCEVYPAPERFAELGGCYRRLWMFSPEAAEVLGERFVSIDLDVVLLADCTDLFERAEPLVLNAYVPGGPEGPDQHYNGGMMLITAGCHPELWEDFDAERTPAMIAEGRSAGLCIGTDQAWIRLRLGKGLPRWTQADGVFDARFTRGARRPPANVRMVFFSGRRDPSCDSRRWVRDAWA